MTHKADGKVFGNFDSKLKKLINEEPKYKFHTVCNGAAVAGFATEDAAKDDAAKRNAKAADLGIKGRYVVEFASDAELVVHND